MTLALSREGQKFAVCILRAGIFSVFRGDRLCKIRETNNKKEKKDDEETAPPQPVFLPVIHRDIYVTKKKKKRRRIYIYKIKCIDKIILGEATRLPSDDDVTTV